MYQNEPKLINAAHNQKQRFANNCSLLCPHPGKVLTIPLLTEEALFTWAYLQEFCKSTRAARKANI